ncbi:hypothetical protein FLAV_01128 [Flavobacteriales bacterium]|nr:hypothetical protein FLAV_01128 [Flavobacteriales bacterium]
MDFKKVVFYFFLFSISCTESKMNNSENYENSNAPLFDLYFKQVHQVDLDNNTVIIVLQNNCKPYSFESITFTEWVCDSVETEFKKYVLIFAKSGLPLKCSNVIKDSVGYYQNYGLYSFYDKVYVVKDRKLIYQNDIITENINAIKEILKKRTLQK